MIDIKTIDDIVKIYDTAKGDEDKGKNNETWQITPCDERGNYDEQTVKEMSVDKDGYCWGNCSDRLRIHGHYHGVLFSLFGNLKPGDSIIIDGKTVDTILKAINYITPDERKSFFLYGWIYNDNYKGNRILKPFYEVKYLGEIE